ncbi:MAG: hypothetical protein IKD75_10120 [Prevotella sp.]|nr:hypothetical protein [Prevotella sp.]
MSSMKLCILGDVWSLEERTKAEDETLQECDGYCDWSDKLIVVQGDMDGDLGNMVDYKRKTMRHEIVHAFLFSSGLGECSLQPESWALNEEMVDWFAHMGPKIYAVWQAAGCV